MNKQISTKIFILIFSSIGFGSFAQIKENTEPMKTKTDSTDLEKLAKYFEKKKVSKDDLKKKAKEMNIPYSGETNGSYFELQGFDDNGNPIYYTTYTTPITTEEPISPKIEKIQPKTTPKNNCKKAKK